MNNILKELEEKALRISYHYKELFEVDGDLFFIVLINKEEFKQLLKLISPVGESIKVLNMNKIEDKQYKITLLNSQCLNLFIVEIQEYIISGSLIPIIK